MAEQVEAIKWVPHTNFLVDGFRFQSPRCSSHFLTHYHGDHTCGAAAPLAATPPAARARLRLGSLPCRPPAAGAAQAWRAASGPATWRR